MEEHRHQNIEVFNDGVKVGWNVLALTASIGLAFYVSAVVSPIKLELENTNKKLMIAEDKIKAIELFRDTEHRLIAQEIHEMKTFKATMSLRADDCESDVKAISNKMEHKTGFSDEK